MDDNPNDDTQQLELELEGLKTDIHDFERIFEVAKESLFLDTYLGCVTEDNYEHIGNWEIEDDGLFYKERTVIFPVNGTIFKYASLFHAMNPELSIEIFSCLKKLGVVIDDDMLFDTIDFLPPDKTNLEEWEKISRLLTKDARASYDGETYFIEAGKLKARNRPGEMKIETYIDWGKETTEIPTQRTREVPYPSRTLFYWKTERRLQVKKEAKKHRAIFNWVRAQFDPPSSCSPLTFNAKKLSNLTNGLSNNLGYFSVNPHEFEYNRETKMARFSQMNMKGQVRKTEMKPGKAVMKLAKILGLEITNDDVKQYVFKLQQSNVYELKVVSGKDIAHYYHFRQTDSHKSTGSLSSSCMRGDKSQGYFKIYDDNCEMLILHKATTDKIIGRAILWTANCGTKVMDRIYSSEGSNPIFKNWAKENGYARRRYQSNSSKALWVMPDGKLVDRNFMIDAGDLSEKYPDMPYMDTFTYYSYKQKLLSNDYSTFNGDDFACLDNLSGAW